MSAEGATRLASQLGLPAADLAGLETLASLGDDQLRVLGSAIRAVMDNDMRNAEASVEQAVSLFPRPLRGRARKMMLPGAR